MLIEKYAGAFPTWLAPVQVKLLPVTDRAIDYVNSIAAKLRQKGLRCEVDTRSEKIGRKIRDAQLDKVPYMLIVGDKEVENGTTVSVRSRREGELGSMNVDKFIEKVYIEDRDKVVYKD